MELRNVAVCLHCLVIHQNDVGCRARIIAVDMQSLRGEADRFERMLGFTWRQVLLTSCDRPLQRGRERAIDPNRQIEMVAIRRLEQKNSFENYDIDLVEIVEI